MLTRLHSQKDLQLQSTRLLEFCNDLGWFKLCKLIFKDVDLSGFRGHRRTPEDKSHPKGFWVPKQFMKRSQDSLLQ